MKDIPVERIQLDAKEHFYSGESCEMYRDRSHVYKIFDDSIHPFTKDKIARIGALQKYKKDLDRHCVIPQRFILDKEGIRFGYITKNHRNTSTLFDTANVSADFDTFRHIMIQLSQILRSLHQNEIILGDFHFDNVLISNKNKVFLVDFDNIKIDDIESFTISRVLGIFLGFYDMSYYDIKISKDTDNLSCLLSILVLFLGDDYLAFDKTKVDYLVKRIPILQEILKILNCVVRTKTITNIPYVDEIMSKRKRPF